MSAGLLDADAVNCQASTERLTIALRARDHGSAQPGT